LRRWWYLREKLEVEGDGISKGDDLRADRELHAACWVTELEDLPEAITKGGCDLDPCSGAEA
jgi:hypothetical protein